MIPLSLLSLALAHPAEQNASPEQIDAWLNSVVLLQTDGAWCSGVVISDTTIATAYHCVATGGPSRIGLRDGRSLMGTSIAAYPKRDLAIIEAELPKDMAQLSIRADSPLPGTTVYALGHPLAPYADKKWLRGTLRWSVSAGVVSAVGESFIQTDASLNPGNSGGPIVDSEGQIVGIASRKLRAENIAFLGPSPQILKLQANPEPLKWWGGQLALGGWYGVLGTDMLSVSMGAYAQYRMRERLIATGAIGTPIVYTDSGLLNNGYLSLALRQGFGQGTAYTTLDLGGGMVATSSSDSPLLSLKPELYGRVGIAAVGLRYGLVGIGARDAQHQLLMEFDLIGVVQVF